MLISLALIVVLMASVAAFYAGAVTTRERGGKLTTQAIQMRATLDQIADDIRNAVPQVLPGPQGLFKGEKDWISVVRTRMTDNGYAFREPSQFDDPPPGQMGLMEVSYKLYWDDEDRKDEEGITICYGVWRTEHWQALDPNAKVVIVNDTPTDEAGDEVTQYSQPDGELFAPEIKYLRFQYWDGSPPWRDRWNVAAGGGSSDSAGSATASSGAGGSTCTLPQAVRITIGRVREPPEEDANEVSQLKEQKEEQEQREHHGDRFSIVVYLPHSDPTQMSTRKKGLKDDRDEMSEQTSGGK